MEQEAPSYGPDLPDIDWSFTEDSALMTAIGQSVARVSWRGTVAYEDLYQEAMVYLAQRPGIVAQGPLRVYMRLLDYLGDKWRNALKIEDATSFLSASDWEDTLSFETGGLQPDEFADMRYPKELVEVLLEAMFNGWAVRDEHRPDPDMPRAKPNPKTSNTIVAHRIDMERAWAANLLTPWQKTLIYCHYGLGYTKTALAELSGVNRHKVTREIQRGVDTVCAHLNGGNW